MRLLTLDLGERAESPVDRAVLRYLEDAPVLIARRSRTIDELVPVRGRVVPSSIHTDGEWVWPASHAYYVRTHQVCVPADFVRCVELSGGSPPRVSVARLAELRGELRRLGL